MEIEAFRALAEEVNFLGERLIKINVGIEACSLAVGTQVRPLSNEPQYRVCYIVRHPFSESNTGISGTGATPQAAIIAAFAQWLVKEFSFHPDPAGPHLMHLERRA